MKDDRELLEALLINKILVGNGKETIQLVEGSIKLIDCSNKGYKGLFLRHLRGSSFLDLEPGYWTIKPEVLLINGIEVPVPEKATPEINTSYYTPYIGNGIATYFADTWEDHSVDTLRLNAGIIHLTIEAAITHAKALLSLTTQEKQDV